MLFFGNPKGARSDRSRDSRQQRQCETEQCHCSSNNANVRHDNANVRHDNGIAALTMPLRGMKMAL